MTLRILPECPNTLILRMVSELFSFNLCSLFLKSNFTRSKWLGSDTIWILCGSNYGYYHDWIIVMVSECFLDPLFFQKYFYFSTGIDDVHCETILDLT